MLLYNSPVSGNCYKVRLLFAHLGIEYERRDLDVVDRSNRGEVLGELNPDLRVPTLVLDDGRPLAESGAILWYFAEGTRFVPADAYERAKVLQWMFFEQYTHEPAIAVVRFLVAYSGDAERHAATIEQRTATGYRALGSMERHLDGNPYFVGDSLTLADIALYAYTHVAHEGGFDLEEYPAIRTWLDRVAAEPGARPDRCLRRPGPDAMRVRVRFAPSPTGSLHLGNALTAVANRRFADEHGGVLVLRIDDTDPTRTVEGGEDAILDDLALARARLGRGAGPPERARRRLPGGRRSARSRTVALFGIRTGRSGSAASRCCGRTGPRRTSSRRLPTTSSSASRTSSADPITGRTRSRSAASPARSAVSFPR